MGNRIFKIFFENDGFTSGFTGNIFHDLKDGFIITINSILPDQDVVLVISEIRDWWFNKYTKILCTFTEYPISNFII